MFFGKGQVYFALILTSFLFPFESLQSQSLVSSIDAEFLWSKLRGESQVSKPQAQSVVVGTYRLGLGSLIGSECKMYPSDSLYFGVSGRRCGSLKAALKSFARFTAERDLLTRWPSQIINDRHIHFLDLPKSCKWFE